MDELEAAFGAGRYADVITLAEAAPPRSPRAQAMYGLALMRSDRLADAEVALTKAAILGDDEARVELGNLARVQGRFDDAIAHFEEITASLEGELRLRALRWWGMAEFQAGRVDAGLRRAERAWHGYIAMGDDELTARVTQSLAWMHQKTGDFARAKALYAEAVRALPVTPVPLPRLTALTNLLNLQIETGDFDAARLILADARETLRHTDAKRPRALLMTAEAELRRLSGEYGAYAEALEVLAPLARELCDHALSVWVTSRLAEHYSRLGLHGRALEELYGFARRPAQWPPELFAASGVLARRRGDLVAAQADLERAVADFRGRGQVQPFVRTSLHLAATVLRAGQEAVAVRVLGDALREMLHMRHHVAFRPDLEELSELLHFAVLEPELAPLMEPVMDNLASLAGAPRLPEDGYVRVQLTTLGRVQVQRNGEPVEFSLRGAPLLLAYLTLNPGRTRVEMQLDLYPEKDGSTGANYIRGALKELRDRLGPDVVRFEGPHRAPWYRVGPYVHVDLDLQHFREAISRGEIARALALYRGEFMPGVEDSAWVAQQRDETLLALTFELKAQMARYRAAGDYRRLILMANQLLRTDPYDREVLEARVEAARIVAPSHELARYVAELHRLHN